MDAATTPGLEAALAELEAFYPRLDEAIAERDAEAVATLIASRGPAVEAVAQLTAADPVAADAARARVQTNERALQGALRELHQQIFDSLAEHRERARAVTRYARSS